MPATGIDAVTDWLATKRIHYRLVEHDPTYSASSEAQVAGYAPEQSAKTVVLRDHEAFRLAVIPASSRLDLHKLRDLLDAGKSLRLATEEEMASELPAFEVGAVPPFGPMLPAPEVVDRRLLTYNRVLCSGGDHRHSLLIDSEDLVRVAGATVADVCED
jgi:Ala-tRNA(Pro) deacylase